jgi:putative flippase GtrA
MAWLVSIHRSIEAALGARAYHLLRYLMSGAAAAASNLLALFLLVQFGRMHYLYASVIAFLASVAVSFTLQKFWTFQDMFIHDVRAQFTRYSAVVLANLTLNTALMYVFVERASLWYVFAQVLTTSIVAVVGYVAYKHFVFRERLVIS